jgi:hypothetical protein
MLQQLPEELLDRILYHVAAFPFIQDPQAPWEEPQNSWIPHQCRSTLLDICLVSKTLYRLALPHLYKPFSNHAERERAAYEIHQRPSYLDASSRLYTTSQCDTSALSARGLTMEAC